MCNKHERLSNNELTYRFTMSLLLTLSIHQDLRELNSICKKISATIDKDQVQSWLFPSKFSSEITDLEISSDAKDTMYVTCLEMLVDR